MNSFKKLFEPLRIERYLLKNRIVMAPMMTLFANADGSVSPKMVKYYEARAKGGVGMIVVEMGLVDTRGRGSILQLRADDDVFIAGLSNLATAIKANGAVATLQIQHGGRFSRVKAPISSSDVGFNVPGWVVYPRPMTIDEILSTEDAYAKAALRAQIAGFDMIELHGGTGYLLSQFISPHTNKRQDQYGGSLENRMRFALETIGAIRNLCGAKFPIGYRFMADELLPDGFHLDEAKIFAKTLEKAGLAYLSVVAGTYESFFIGEGVVSTRSPRGGTVNLTEAIKKEVSIPVFVNGKISNPQFAEEILSQGKADAVALARPLFADPNFAKKAKEGRPEDIIECIACMNCMQQTLVNAAAVCTVSPVTGREGEVTIEDAKKPKKVFVVGGGPAGTMAAISAARRGHNVRLYEKSDSIGGKLHVALLPPGKKELEKPLTYLQTQLKKTNVDVRLKSEFTLKDLEEKPDVLIIATGALPRKNNLPGINSPKVVHLIDVLQNKVETGKRPIVVGGGAESGEVAEFLAAQGKEVTLVAKYNQVAQESGISDQALLMQKLFGYRVNIIFRNVLTEVTPDGAIIEDAGLKTEIKGDSIVLGWGYDPDYDLYLKAKDLVEDIYLIGDAFKPRRLRDAILEGFQTGIAI